MIFVAQFRGAARHTPLRRGDSGGAQMPRRGTADDRNARGRHGPTFFVVLIAALAAVAPPAAAQTPTNISAASGLSEVSSARRSAGCRSTLPPASRRAGYWSYRLVRGRKCWSGPLRANANLHTRRVPRRAAVLSRSTPTPPPTPAPTPAPSPAPTPSPSSSPSSPPSPTPSPSLPPTPTTTPAPTPTPSPSPTASPTPSPLPTPATAPAPLPAPTPAATTTPTATPAPTPPPAPTPTPSHRISAAFADAFVVAPLPVAIPLPPRPAPGVRSVLFALVLSALVACAGFLLVSRSTGVRVTGAAIAGPGQNVMTLITTDTFGYVKQNIDKLVQQAGV